MIQNNVSKRGFQTEGWGNRPEKNKVSLEAEKGRRACRHHSAHVTTFPADGAHLRR